MAKSRHPDLADALRALEHAVADVPAGEPRSALSRSYSPAEQVAARGELEGPRGARGGVDLRGDGTAQAWTGRISKQPVVPSAGESPYAALARALTA